MGTKSFVGLILLKVVKIEPKFGLIITGSFTVTFSATLVVSLVAGVTGAACMTSSLTFGVT
jgi:hypothetical protein